MFCPHCGKECPDNAAFCPECGKRTDGRDMQSQPTVQKPFQPGGDGFVQPTEASSEAALATEICSNFRVTKYVLVSCLALIALTAAFPVLNQLLSMVVGALEIGLIIWSFVFLNSVQGFFQQAGAYGFVSQCRSIRTSFILLIVANILLSVAVTALVALSMYNSIKSNITPQTDLQALANGELSEEMMTLAPMLSGIMLCFMTYPVVKFFYMTDVFRRVSQGAEVRQLVPANHSKTVLLISAAIMVIMAGLAVAHLLFNRVF